MLTTDTAQGDVSGSTALQTPQDKVSRIPFNLPTPNQCNLCKTLFIAKQHKYLITDLGMGKQIKQTIKQLTSRLPRLSFTSRHLSFPLITAAGCTESLW